MFDTNRQGPGEGSPRLVRWELDPVTGAATETTVEDRPHEFPRIDESRIGLPYRYGYSAGIGAGFAQGGLLKTDLETGTTEVRSDTDRYGYGEPVFVARHDGPGRAEDDGWVMALRHDTATDRSELVVLDAGAFTDEPVAVVSLPARVPNGFHGNWVPTGT
jgi:carotenoid cleavage dioxygenase